MTPMMFPYVTCSARHKWDEELKWQSTRSSGGGGGAIRCSGDGLGGFSKSPLSISYSCLSLITISKTVAVLKNKVGFAAGQGSSSCFG